MVSLHETSGTIIALSKPLVPGNGLGSYHVRIPTDFNQGDAEVEVSILDGPVDFEFCGQICPLTSITLTQEKIKQLLQK